MGHIEATSILSRSSPCFQHTFLARFAVPIVLNGFFWVCFDEGRSKEEKSTECVCRLRVSHDALPHKRGWLFLSSAV